MLSRKDKLVPLLVLICIFLAITVFLTQPAGAERVNVLRYDDTGLVSVGDFSIYYWYPPDDIEVGSLIRNGDFQEWSEGKPEEWTIWMEAKAGWEARISQIDFAIQGGENDAIGFFVQNKGGDGHYYAGAYQPLQDILSPGAYWVTTHMTMWGETKDTLYNAVAWYGIGDTVDPGSVHQWREMSPLPIPCPNELGYCLYIGRYETVDIAPGEYFHFRVGHNFPEFNAWTVFGLDDFAIIPAEGEVIEDGFWPDGLVRWDPRESR